MSPATTTVDISVTPQFKQGNTVYCEIDPRPGSGRYVKGGIIKLPNAGETYKLNFTLDTAAVESSADELSWDENEVQCKTSSGTSRLSNAFWSDRGNCPRTAMQDSQVRNVSVNGGTLTVEIVPDSRKNVVHYSLNFADGSSCDPIIINT